MREPYIATLISVNCVCFVRFVSFHELSISFFIQVKTTMEVDKIKPTSLFVVISSFVGQNETQVSLDLIAYTHVTC
jgi:hypothetical protein